MQLLPTYRGTRIRPYMRFMKYRIFLTFFIPMALILVFFVYWNIEKIINLNYIIIGISNFLLFFFIGLSVYLTWFSQEAIPYFKKLERKGKLAFFLYENGYTYTQKGRSGGREKVRFPVVYLKQGAYDLEVAFKMAGNKFQSKFKAIGGELEDTFFMDYMETMDDTKFKTYKLAYSAFLSRISVSEVEYVEDKGLKLMKNLYWDFTSDPHLLVAGGTGGGKTVFLRSILVGLAKIGVVDICDPKRADFVTMADIPAFENRVSFEIEDIIERFENALVIMMSRYDFMRSEMKRLGHKDMKKYSDYGLEPYFLVCDEYNSLIAMLDFKQRDRLESVIGPFLLLGRQAGCFGIIAMQKPAREDLPSKLQANINFRISVGRLDEAGYATLYGDINSKKSFKYLKYLSGRRVYGRGYTAVFGEVAREFYSPEWNPKFSFFKAFSEIERHENPFDSKENASVKKEVVADKELVDFVHAVSGDNGDKKDDFLEAKRKFEEDELFYADFDDSMFDEVKEETMDFVGGKVDAGVLNTDLSKEMSSQTDKSIFNLLSVKEVSETYGINSRSLRKLVTMLRKEGYEFEKRNGITMISSDQVSMFLEIEELSNDGNVKSYSKGVREYIAKKRR